MAEEQSTRKAWQAAIKRTVPAFTTDLPIVESVTACWTGKTDDTIHTASGDAETSWRPPTLRCVGDRGSWGFDRSGVSPAIDEDKWWPVETDSGSDSGAGGAAARMIVTVVFVQHRLEWN